MNASEVHELTDRELVKSLDDNQRELLNLRIQQQTGQLENTARVREVRRLIARLRTEETTRRAAGA
jgi:large subunit ribosomal protein L29